LGRPPFEAGRAGERATRNSSKSRDIVLDPFGGSGSTLFACEKAGRQARSIELDPEYCDVIVRRFQAAVLDGDGRSFEEIAARGSVTSSASLSPLAGHYVQDGNVWYAAAVSTNPCQTARL
jgi:hypothetical protein